MEDAKIHVINLNVKETVEDLKILQVRIGKEIQRMLEKQLNDLVNEIVKDNHQKIGLLEDNELEELKSESDKRLKEAVEKIKSKVIDNSIWPDLSSIQDGISTQEIEKINEISIPAFTDFIAEVDEMAGYVAAPFSDHGFNISRLKINKNGKYSQSMTFIPTIEITQGFAEYNERFMVLKDLLNQQLSIQENKTRRDALDK